MRKQTNKWKQRDGTKIRICDMTDQHLRNVMKLLERLADYERARILHFFLNSPPPNGEMARDDFEHCVDEAINATMEDFLPDIYWSMIEEKERRESGR